MIENLRAALAGAATILSLGIVMLIIEPDVAARTERLHVSPVLEPIWALGWLVAPIAIVIGIRRGRLLIPILTGQFQCVGNALWTRIGNAIIMLASAAAAISLTNEIANAVRRTLIGA